MFTLRCTQRLMKRLKAPLANEAREPSTALGDWQANLLHLGRLQLVLAVSERTLLPVIVPAAPIGTLVPRFRLALTRVLRELGVSAADIEMEDAEMDRCLFGPTANRQAMGVLVEFAKALDFYLDDEASLLDLSLRLAETPCKPLWKTEVSPDRATVALFQARPPLLH